MVDSNTRKHYKKLDRFIRKLSPDERHALNMYLMSGEGPLPAGSNLDAVLDFLKQQPAETWQGLVVNALGWIVENKDFKPISEDLAVRRQLNLTINATDSVDPTTVILLSRDINDATKLTLQEINVDSGDYIPVPVESLAGLLREYADVMETRQAEINNWGEQNI